MVMYRRRGTDRIVLRSLKRITCVPDEENKKLTIIRMTLYTRIKMKSRI